MPEKTIYSGLTTAEVQEKLKENGYNEIKQEQNYTIIKSFFSQFDNFLIILLILAGVISFFLGERIDTLFILLIVLLNACFGVYQEFKAEKALNTLKDMTISTVRVFRDGIEKEIDNRLLVPGDIIYLEEGSKVPADSKVLDSMNLEINEASLTGESMPVEKHPSENENGYIYLGTIVAKGRGVMEVIKTGSQTRFGSIAKTLSEIEKIKTPLQKKLDLFTKQIGLIGIMASIIVFVLSFIKNKTIFESFIFAVSLAVAAVPEGLPAVMTITLAIGVELMAKKKAIIRKLNAIEALGSVTLVATDKTGTLTTNKMKVKKLWLDQQVFTSSDLPKSTNKPFAKLLLDGILCSTASLVETIGSKESDVIGDTTEGAILLLAQKAGLNIDDEKSKWKIVEEIPFHPGSKRMSVVVKKKNERYVFTKGAPENILSISNYIQTKDHTVRLTPDNRKHIESAFRVFAKEGLRMLAFSYKPHTHKPIESEHIFIGFVGISDPVREEIRLAVHKAQEAGIRVVMITGDNELTAEAVGIEAGIISKGEDMLLGKQIEFYSDKDLLPLMDKIKIFARTTPEHKYRLVKLYQQKGEIVSVTGDGVNDALALKQADVGVAMGITGTDVAKETADMIITDDNFATIINAIEQGRNIYNQIKNAIKYLLACNLGEILYVLSAVLFNLPVMTPIQILYINIATDGLPALCLAFAPNDRNIMHRKPRRLISILDNHDYKYLFIIGFSTALTAYLSTLPYIRYEFIVTSTILFTSIIIIQQFILIDLWLGQKPILRHLKLLAHPIFLLAFFFPFILHPFILYIPFISKLFDTTPLTPSALVGTIVISSLIIIIYEIIKKRPLKKYFYPHI